MTTEESKFSGAEHSTTAILPSAPGAKLPLPHLGKSSSVPSKLYDAWTDYMVKGFDHNQEMFKRTLEAFMRPYQITVGMYVVLFVIGMAFFGLAVFLGIRDGQSLVAVAFGGLSVASFVLFFFRQPVQALEENLEFISWLGVAFNTYWTRLMYMENKDTIQAELKAATDDYSKMVERLISRHAELRRKRPGGKLTEVQPIVTAPGEAETPAPQDMSQSVKSE